jgi:phosphatidylinositol alpha-1,6-mannosyltransferase
MPLRRRLAFERATVRLACSEYTRERVRDAHPELEPVETCELGLLPAAGEGRTPAASRRSVVILGRVSVASRYKGHDALLDAWPLVRAAVPDAELLVVGKGDDAPRLQARAAALALCGVRFLGFLPDASLEALLQRAGLLALPSAIEGFGLAYLMAMRAGLPCVATAAGTGSGLVRDGETGIVCESAEPTALAAAITRLLRDEPLRERLGGEGRRRYERGYTFDHFCGRLARAIAPLLDPKE